MFYPDQPYYEWYVGNGYEDENKTIDESITYLEEYMKSNGPYCGVLGFSQGNQIKMV